MRSVFGALALLCLGAAVVALVSLQDKAERGAVVALLLLAAHVASHGARGE